MQLTINRMREHLFDRESVYCKWNKKSGKCSYDPFIASVFDFLEAHHETEKAFQQLLDTESSHDNFCRGSLRSDGYYPVKAVNAWIYQDLTAHSAAPDDAETIQALQCRFQYLEGSFASALTEQSRVFTELLTQENCFGSRLLYVHLRTLLENGKYMLVLAWMTVIAVFPRVTSVTERKPDYAQMLLQRLFADQTASAEPPSLNRAYEAFLEEKLSLGDPIEEVIIVHNHGLRPLMNQARNHLLKRLIDRADRVKILMTEHEMGERFTKHIRNHDMLYLSSYMPPVLMWRDFCRQFQDKVTLHLSPIPAIHQYTEIRFRNSANSACFVGFYLYGDTAFDQSPFMVIPYGSAYYGGFRTEFEYAWSRSHPYTDAAEDLSGKTAAPDAAGFVSSGIERGANAIDFAFYVGWEWLTGDIKLAALTKMLEKRIPLRVLINDADAVKNLLPHMRSKNKAYVGLAQNIRQWSAFQKKYPDLVQVRVLHIPLLHSYFHIRTENSPTVRLSFYSYDNPIITKNYVQLFQPDSPYYRLFVDEFEYLWQQGDDVSSLS